jgi:hypothetical protein
MSVADLDRAEGERRLVEADAALAQIDASDVVAEDWRWNGRSRCGR